MPLVKEILITKIRELNDSDFSGFKGFPSNPIEASINWANAIDTYMGINILPTSTTSGLAKTALQGALAAMTVPLAAKQVFPLALQTYLTTLAGGMAPAFVAVPPLLVPNLEPAFKRGEAGASGLEVATLMANIIDTWARTGIAVNSISGVTINFN